MGFHIERAKASIPTEGVIPNPKLNLLDQVSEVMRLGKDEHRTVNVQHPTSNAESMGTRYDLEERLLDYSARIVRLAERLPRTRVGNHVGAQLLRSGTSPLPNHGEAQVAESADDFVHKLKICLKELRESFRWLRLIQRVPLLKPIRVQPLIDETDELIRIFVQSIKTARANGGRTSNKHEH
jgi:four helix bundle protein